MHETNPEQFPEVEQLDQVAQTGATGVEQAAPLYDQFAEHADDSQQALYDEYAAAVQDEASTVRIKNPETGKLEATKVKDLNFREWLKATESRKAARWYSETRAHGEVPEGEIGDLGNGDASGALADREDAERLNAQSGKSNPTEDDVNYYRWLKNNDGNSEELPTEPAGPEVPTEPAGPDVPTEPAGPDVPAEEVPAEPTQPEVPTEEVPAEPLPTSPEFEAANADLIRARDNLARIRASREVRTIHGRKYSKKALEAAITDYKKALATAGAYAAEMFENAGMEPETINSLINQSAMQECVAITERQRELELANAERKGLFGRFYNYWARHSQAPLLSKQGLVDLVAKGAVMAPLGIALGVAVAPALAAVGSGIVAGATVAGTRFTRGLMGAKISKEAGARDVATKKASDRINNLVGQIHAAQQQGYVVDQLNFTTDIYRHDTNRTANSNRKRAIVAAAAAAAIGGATSLALDHIGFDFFGHHVGGNGETPQHAAGPNGQPALTPEQVKIFNSEEFKRMVAEGNKIHEQVNNQYPIPQGANFWERVVMMVQRNSIADRRVVEALEYITRLENASAAATGSAPSTL